MVSIMMQVKMVVIGFNNDAGEGGGDDDDSINVAEVQKMRRWPNFAVPEYYIPLPLQIFRNFASFLQQICVI